MQHTFQCYRCGSQNYSGQQFCSNCGHRLPRGASKLGDEHKGLKIAALVCGILAIVILLPPTYIISMSMREETRIIQLVTSIIFMITMIICIVGVSSVFYKPRIASLLSVLSVVGLSISITIQNSAQSLLGLTIPISLLLASSVMSWIAGRQASY